MEKGLLGIHHITAVAGDPQRNVDFYAGFLGLRLIKLTVNFDDPTTYHLYYGDELGHPGTILTFFPWPAAPKGRIGTGQLTTISFSIPETALSFWMDRLKSQGFPFQGPSTRFGETLLSFSDPDGLQLELVAGNAAMPSVWKEGLVPPEYAVSGFHGVTLTEASQERTASLLAETMGFRRIGRAGARTRFGIGGDVVDLVSEPEAARGLVSVGTVHHIAWRTPDDEQQKSWRQKLLEIGLSVTPVIDRKYFHSIYFREPGGVLFEVATDPPGFTVDESATQLGTKLKLPPWLEPKRPEIEQALPPLRLPSILKAS
jgi:glyoxalase family protein